MADRYVVIPAHLVRHSEQFNDAAVAAVEASQQVGKDRVPRVVVQLISQVSAKPHVQMVQIAEVARG